MKTGINLKIKNNIAFLTINRPKQRNALDLKSADDFLEAVRMIDVDDKVHVVILTGSGGVFCAGADLSEMAEKGAIYRAWAGADGPWCARRGSGGSDATAGAFRTVDALRHACHDGESGILVRAARARLRCGRALGAKRACRAADATCTPFSLLVRARRALGALRAAIDGGDVAAQANRWTRWPAGACVARRAWHTIVAARKVTDHIRARVAARGDGRR